LTLSDAVKVWLFTVKPNLGTATGGRPSRMTPVKANSLYPLMNRIAARADATTTTIAFRAGNKFNINKIAI